jgi:hypothetical protein
MRPSAVVARELWNVLLARTRVDVSQAKGGGAAERDAPAFRKIVERHRDTFDELAK